jgi:cytochrome d ubiquinol oxidase subunit II
MFENLSYESLQAYWWIIISLLGALLVFLLFVQGGQTLFNALSNDEKDRTLLINTMGRKWEFTFTTLVTFGGAFFASFPLFYASSFGGAYWVWMIILFAFVLQAVSYEFRSKAGNFLGAKTYQAFLFANGLIGTIFLGTAVATFFTGSGFHLTPMNNTIWESPMRGLELALNLGRYETYVNLSLGLAVFFLARVLALQYFAMNVESETVANKSQKCFVRNAALFLITFLFFLINILIMDGYHVGSASTIELVANKYLHNLLDMPVVMSFMLIGIALVLFSFYRSIWGTQKHKEKSFWLGGIGTVLTVFALFLIAGLNQTAFYPSYSNLQSSLHIGNACSSQYTLTAMSYVSLMVPFVFAYIWYAWKSINNKKLTKEELETESHVY